MKVFKLKTIGFCLVSILIVTSCQNQNTDGYNPNDTIYIEENINSDTIVEHAEEPTGGMKLVPIVTPKDSTKAIQYKDSALTLLIRHGNLQDAKYMADQAIYNNPDDADSWYIRGNINQKLVRYNDALEDFNKAIEIKPDHFDAIKKAAILSSKTGDEGMACYYLWKGCNMGDPEACEGVEKFCNNK